MLALRRVRVVWFIRGRVVSAFCAVFLLGGAPIGAHLFAVQANEESANRTQDFWPILIADVYLYAFIIALAGVVDALAARQTSIAIVFLFLALIAGFGNYNGMLNVVVEHHVGALLALPVWVILGVTALGYAWFKAIRLYAAGAEDWDKREKRLKPKQIKEAKP